MGKAFAVPPSYYLGIEDRYLAWQVDLACFAAMITDDNQAYSNANKTSNNESAAIGRVLDDYRKKLNER